MSQLAKFINALVTQGLENFGRYYSVYRGYVANNEDPEKYGRLQLAVPQVYGDDVNPTWAWPRNTFSGKDYGAHVIPQKGDTVFVEFEGGNPKFPIWSHGHFAKGEITEDNLKSTKNFWFKTPSGHLVEFDDEKNLIRITHKGGDVITFKNDLIYIGDETTDQFIPKGNALKEQLEKEKLRVDLLYQAIQSGVTIPYDGGASYKATMTAIIQLGQAPDYTNILSTKVKVK